MALLPTLRRELLGALALVFIMALTVAAFGIILVLPHFVSPLAGTFYVGALLVADLAVFLAFGRYLVERRVLAPIQKLLLGVEAIAAGDYARRLPQASSAEMSRLAESVNRMAEHLIAHQQALADNVQSLEMTNRELTEARDAMIRA